MIHPSYSELIEAINTNNEDDDEALVLNSRYSLVLAASKRARQLSRLYRVQQERNRFLLPLMSSTRVR